MPFAPMPAPCLATPAAGLMAMTRGTPFRPMPLSRASACGFAHRCTVSFGHLISEAIVPQSRSGACDLLQRIEARFLLAAQRGIELVERGLHMLGGLQH